METIFPQEPGVAGAFLFGWRRRPGSGVSSDNIEQTATVVLKRAYQISAPDADPTLGALVPLEAAPVVFEGDQPGQVLANGDFSQGLDGWSETGSASASVVEEALRVERSGGSGDVRTSYVFPRQLRERGIGLAVKASADEGLANPQPRAVAGSETGPIATDPALFPAADDQPVLLSDYDRLSASASGSSLSVRLPAMGADDQVVTYDDVMITLVEYENDLVPFKPEADIIAIADAPPLPLSISVNGAERMSQASLATQELTGLGWEDRVDTPREAEGGDFSSLTQALPDDFDNRFFNGYRRDRRVGASVPYLEAGDEIVLERDGADDYGFTLPDTAPVVRHEWFTGQGRDDPCLWRRRELPMQLDTLVIEPDRDLAYAVWRAVWPLAFDPDGTGPVPLENNRRITVELRGS